MGRMAKIVPFVARGETCSPERAEALVRDAFGPGVTEVDDADAAALALAVARARHPSGQYRRNRRGSGAA